MRVTLNPATRPFADLGPAIKRLRIAMGVLAVLAIALGFGLRALHQKAEQARARERAVDAQIARVTAERQGYEALMHRPDNAQLLTEAGDLNKLFDEKAFSWTLAMEDLETVLPGGVQVTTLEPSRSKDGHITLRMHVIGPRDKDVELVRNLEHSRRFLQPRIVGESSDTNGTPGEKLEPVSASSRVTFDLLADYNPSSAGERKPAHKKGEGASASATHRKAIPSGNTVPPGPGLRRPPYTGPRAQPSVPKPQAGEPK